MSYNKAKLFTCAALGTLMLSGTLSPAQATIKSDAVWMGDSGVISYEQTKNIYNIAHHGEHNNAKQAQEFVQNMGADAIAFLSDNSLDEGAKQKRFATMLDQNFDMQTIGRFVLGRYWKQYTPEQQAEYQKHFRSMIVSIYSDRLEEYDNQNFEVTGADKTKDDEYTVNSNIVSETGQTIPVAWKVRDKDGSFKIIDVSVENVSMAITKRNEFSSIIQSNGGNPAALLDHMKAKAK